MIILDIDDNSEGRWFTFFYSNIDPNTLEVIYGDPIEGGPQMLIRDPAPLWREKSDKRKKEKKIVPNPKTRGMCVVEDEIELTPAQKKAENEEFCDYVIQGVKGFTMKGKEIKNTVADKVKLMENPQVAMFVQKCIQDLQKLSIQEKQTETKNS